MYPTGEKQTLEKQELIAAATSLWLIVAVALACRVGYAYHE